MAITSISNPKIKRLVALGRKKKARDEEHVFLTEGIRMFREIPADLLKELYVSESFFNKEQEMTNAMALRSRIIPEIVSDNVFSHISDTQSPQGVLCVARRRYMQPLEFESGNAENGTLYLVLDRLQDPGNVGTIIRTAEAAGASGVILGPDCADMYNPKTIRSTMGSIYRMPIFYTEQICETICRMKKQGVRVYAAHLSGSIAYDQADYSGASAFLIGNEGNGLSEEVAVLADSYVQIPMKGQVESLNAAMAAAILLFEVARQKRQR